MQIDITINKGRGYVPADENREYCTDVNVIPIDSIYTPIRNVKYAPVPGWPAAFFLERSAPD